MQLTANGRPVDTSPSRLGPLEPATELLGDGDGLRQAMADRGYLFFPGLLDIDTVLAARREILTKYAIIGEIDDRHPIDDAVAGDRAGVASANLRAFSESVRSGHWYRQVTDAELLLAMWGDLLDAPVHCYDFRWPRFVRPGESCGFHCDGPYMSRGTDRLFTSWIPLGRVRREEGALIVLEDSHRNAELQEGYLRADADRDGLVWLDDDPVAVQERFGRRWLTADFEAGDVLCFTMATLHGALDNRSPTGRCRLSSDSRYQPADEARDPRWNGTVIEGHGDRRVFYPGLGQWNNEDFQDEWKRIDEHGRLVRPSEAVTGADTDQVIQLAVDALCDLEHPVKVEAAAWAEEHLTGRARVDADRESVFDEEGWRRCAERGVQGLLVPVEHGGQGVDLVTALLTLEGLGVGARDQSLLFAVASQICSTQVALTTFGSDDQRQRWLPALCRGEAIGAFAITEPGRGSDTDHIEARAERVTDGYRLDGHKAYITPAPRADVAVVFASTDPEARGWGISAFVVPTDTPGVTLGPNREKLGMRTTPFGDIVLDGVVLPESARLGPEGAGTSIFLHAMESERSFLFAPQIGAMERQLREAIAFARERRVGDRPIGDLQAVSHRIADMKARHETARVLVYKAALHSIRREPVAMAAALAKLAASEGAAASGVAAVQLFGAQGYVSEFEHERDARDALGGLIYSGTSDIQRNIIARLLGATKGSR